ncbi:hypothetical protein ATCC90586_011278 [Pythium insidiosum]|nr:hypothetical protein ATCC90586_011278 [Pythium insidiosum]
MARMKRTHAPGEETAAEATGAPTNRTPVVGPAAPKRRRRRGQGRSSSDRGRAFRRRQQQQQDALEADVQRLQREVREKQFLRGVWEAKQLRLRHSQLGSSVRTILEYHDLFRRGLKVRLAETPMAEQQRARRQEAFLHSVMTENVVTGGELVGPESSLEQWRRHTIAFPQFLREATGDPIVAGSESCPIVIVRSLAQVLIGHETLVWVFPSVEREAPALAAQILGRLIHLSCRSSYRFDDQGRITWELIEVDFVGGFLNAGLRPRDVARLMRLSVLSPETALKPGD